MSKIDAKRKVAALLNLSLGTPYENEAIAARRAAETMAKKYKVKIVWTRKKKAKA